MKKLAALTILMCLAVGTGVQAQTTIWQIGTPDGAVDPIVGSAEYPANDVWTSTFDYTIGDDSDPIGSPSCPGYIGPDNVCAFASGRPCTDTTAKLDIHFTLDCYYVAKDLTLYYDRYGSESDDIYLDGVLIDTISATEGGFRQFNWSLGDLALGEHTLTIEYAGGGDGNGHYVDYLKLVSAFPPVCDCQAFPLCAGQSTDVGSIHVAHSDSQLFVTFELTYPDACLVETHVAVGDIPVTKGKGNPIPGQFPYSDSHGCVGEYTYAIPLPTSSPISIAAHAVVQMPTSGSSDVCASVVHAYAQGEGVVDARAIAENALGTPNSPNGTIAFVSLGLNGEIVLDFETLVGGSLNIYEVTWGNRAAWDEETAEVYVSRDADKWTYLGTASNHDVVGVTSDGVTTLPLNECIQYVKLVDTSVSASVDGFDLDAICAAYTCNEETAWGDGCSGSTFNDKNWATFFEYTIADCPQ